MWEIVNGELCKDFTFENFTEAFGFMTKVAIVAEKLNHHPTWTNTWNKVSIRLVTHDAGHTITEKDHQLAQQIDALC